MNYDDLHSIWGIHFECSLNNDLNKDRSKMNFNLLTLSLFKFEKIEKFRIININMLCLMIRVLQLSSIFYSTPCITF